MVTKALKPFLLALLIALPAAQVKAQAVAPVLPTQPPAEKSATSKSTPVEFPPELVHFTPYEKKPVFTASPVAAGKAWQWDAKLRERGFILHEPGIWRMWYTGYDGTRESKRALGYATSNDGLNWTRDPRNPIYSDVTIEDMQVLRHDGKYYMFAEGANDRAQWFTSPDGIAWTRKGTLDLRLANGTPIAEGSFGTPTVWHEDGVWYLLYECGDQAVWLATSKDLTTWTNVQDDPVLSPGPGEYDSVMIAVNQVIKYNGRYYAFYHGSGAAQPPRTWTTNIATSTDRIHWKKYPGNPIIPGDRSSGIVVPVEVSEKSSTATSNFSFPAPTEFRLYTLHNEVDVFLPAAK